MLNLLLYIFVLIIPIGELIRVDAGNSIVIKPLDILSVIILLITIIKYGRHLSIKNNIVVKPLLIFISVAAVSLIVNIQMLTKMQLLASFLYLIRWISYASLFVAVIFSPALIRKRILFLIFVSSSIIIFLGFVQFAFYSNLANLRYLGWDIHWWRLYSTFLDPNFTGIYLVLFFLLTFDKLKKGAVRSNLVFGGICLITLIAILLTFSRSAFISLIIGLVTYFILNKQNKLYMLITCFIFCIGIGVILINSSRTEGTKLFRKTSSVQRLQSLQEGFYIFSREPLFGVGFNAFRYAQFRYGTGVNSNWQVSHSNAGIDDSLLFVFGTTGLVGGSAYIYLLFVLLKFTKKSPGIFAGIIALCVGSTFVNALFYPAIMALLWVSSATIEKT